jgi:tRNA threonylcarbamoyladenosine biosynthesis protein TsaE
MTFASVKVSFVSPRPEDTERFGAELARLLRPGDTVLLSGDLGAGKTTLVRGLARALGVEGPVTSPTFVLLHSYPTPKGFDLLHADAWRLEQLQEVIDLAIPELLEEGAAAVIEWGERAAPALAGDCLHVGLEFVEPGAQDPSGRAGEGDSEVALARGKSGEPSSADQCGPEGARLLTAYASGPSWQKRLAQLQAATLPPTSQAGPCELASAPHESGST